MCASWGVDLDHLVGVVLLKGLVGSVIKHGLLWKECTNVLITNIRRENVYNFKEITCNDLHKLSRWSIEQEVSGDVN